MPQSKKQKAMMASITKYDKKHGIKRISSKQLLNKIYHDEIASGKSRTKAVDIAGGRVGNLYRLRLKEIKKEGGR